MSKGRGGKFINNVVKLYTYEHSNDPRYFAMFLKIWDYIREHVIDQEGGEWHEIIENDGTPRKNEVKAGFWKCPYHNTRALIESIQRIKHVHKESVLV
jgi:mannobiose 2-epimerase